MSRWNESDADPMQDARDLVDVEHVADKFAMDLVYWHNTVLFGQPYTWVRYRGGKLHLIHGHLTTTVYTGPEGTRREV